MKAEINRSGCIGCGTCASICPSVFQMADDGLAEVIAEPTPDMIGLATDARNSCPVSVISITE